MIYVRYVIIFLKNSLVNPLLVLNLTFHFLLSNFQQLVTQPVGLSIPNVYFAINILWRFIVNFPF